MFTLKNQTDGSDPGTTDPAPLLPDFTLDKNGSF